MHTHFSEKIKKSKNLKNIYLLACVYWERALGDSYLEKDKKYARHQDGHKNFIL
jgi:hypothetical protein